MTLEVRAAPGFEPAAEELRHALEARSWSHTGPERLTLEIDERGLTLVRDDSRPALRLHLDFASGRQGYRLAHSGHQREDLIRALGGLPRDSLVVDATAGLGRDTLLLAAHGFRVHAWERHPVVYRLLADALERAGQGAALAALVRRITLHEGAADPASLAEIPAAAVFDPMFPERRKRAAVKKDLQLLQLLMPENPDSDAEETLTLLRSRVSRRVVVKRPLHAPALGPQPPQTSVRGRSTRFDIYPSMAGPTATRQATG